MTRTERIAKTLIPWRTAVQLRACAQWQTKFAKKIPSDTDASALRSVAGQLEVLAADLEAYAGRLAATLIGQAEEPREA